MAATAVYAILARIPTTGVPTEAFEVSNISATPTNDWHINGGLYTLMVKASTYGTVTLKVLLPDDTTYVAAMTAISADGISPATWLAPGQYSLVIA